MKEGLPAEKFALVNYRSDTGERVKVLTEKEMEPPETTETGIRYQLDVQKFPCNVKEFKAIEGAQHKTEKVVSEILPTNVSAECPTVYDRPRPFFKVTKNKKHCDLVMTTCAIQKNKAGAVSKHTHTHITFSYKPK
ncbi:MAG: hypothetical protein ACRC24_00180 [Vibrionaceae bacterium]